MQYHAIPCNTMQYHAIPCNNMQYYAIPCNTMQYHAILCNTMQHQAISCIINNCWRSVPLPCGQYMAIFKTYLVFITFTRLTWPVVRGSFLKCGVTAVVWIVNIAPEHAKLLDDFLQNSYHPLNIWAIPQSIGPIVRFKHWPWGSLISTTSPMSTMSRWCM